MKIYIHSYSEILGRFDQPDTSEKLEALEVFNERVVEKFSRNRVLCLGKFFCVEIIQLGPDHWITHSKVSLPIRRVSVIRGIEYLRIIDLDVLADGSFRYRIILSRQDNPLSHRPTKCVDGIRIVGERLLRRPVTALQPRDPQLADICKKVEAGVVCFECDRGR